MMGLDYAKWDSLDVSSSSSSSSASSRSASPQPLSTRSASSSSSKIAAALRLKALASESDSRPKGCLVTIPWDSHCEAVRWALDRHGISYIEESVPWGLHLWLALAYSDKMPKPQQTSVPVFKTGKGEVLKRSSTDVFTYLFAHSLSSPIRLYTPPSALDLQSYFDTTLAPAARTVFLHTLLTACPSSLARAYLVDTVHLNTWRALGQATWWAVRMVMRRRFCCSDEEVESAWVVVTEVYEKVEEELRKQEQAQQRSHHHKKRKQPFLCGPTVTAADISFAAHSILVLFASRDDDSFASCLRLSVPPLSSLPKRVSTRIRILRATAAGQHAIRMYKRERGGSDGGMGSFRSRYARANNPWWAEVDVLNACAASVTGIVLIVGVLLGWRFGVVKGVLLGAAMLVGAAVGVWYGVQGTLCEERARQLWFVCFG
ncbi:hypothetical protein DFJ77DRAFT_488766 [Powellomyces hirtus]|nr:hypothetical protein DFJ77DRAFT_488766 [Powellomyces hirtus]